MIRLQLNISLPRTITAMVRIIGVMSGSSLDGLDVAQVAFTQGHWQLEKQQTFTLPKQVKQALNTITDQKAFELAESEALFSAYVSSCLDTFINSKDNISAIGIHGHTVLHSPKHKTSWQLLNGGRIAAELDLPIICDFRTQDMALGGQGTPMAVIADRDLYPGYDYYINLGGIANISTQYNGEWRAYDICPCNQFLNFFSQQAGLEYDKDGLIASTGQVNQGLLKELNQESFFTTEPPKSLDNSYIKTELINKIEDHELSVPDFLRTLTEFIALQLANNLRSSHSKVLLTGGGVKNAFLITRLKALVKNKSELIIPDAKTIDYKEAILIAYCTHLRMEKRSNFIASATGALKASSGGAIYLPPKSIVND